MDHRAAALEQAGGEAGDIANRAASEGEDRGAAPDIAPGKAVGDRRQRLPILCRLAFGDHDRRLERDRGEGGAMQAEHPRVGHQRQRMAIGQGHDPVERRRHVADQHVIRTFTLTDRDRDRDHLDKCWSSATMIASTTSPCPPAPLRMWMWASA